MSSGVIRLRMMSTQIYRLNKIIFTRGLFAWWQRVSWGRWKKQSFSIVSQSVGLWLGLLLVQIQFNPKPFRVTSPPSIDTDGSATHSQPTTPSKVWQSPTSNNNKRKKITTTKLSIWSGPPRSAVSSFVIFRQRNASPARDYERDIMRDHNVNWSVGRSLWSCPTRLLR